MDVVTEVPSGSRGPLQPIANRGVAVFAILASALIAFGLGSFAIWLIRDRLHIRCGMGQAGSEGGETWTCSDGIGYLGAAVALGAIWFLTVLFGAIVAGTVRNTTNARVMLALLALMATACIFGLTWYGSSELVDDEYSPLTGTGYWIEAVGAAAVVSAIALLVALASLAFGGRAARVMCGGAAAGLILATILQPGLGINLIPGAGLLAAASVRATTPSPTEP